MTIARSRHINLQHTLYYYVICRCSKRWISSFCPHFEFCGGAAPQCGRDENAADCPQDLFALWWHL
ncbi:hypothetical protein ACEUBE_19210 [Aeromonas veronii]